VCPTAYARQINAFLVVHKFPKHRRAQRIVYQTKEEAYVGSLIDLIVHTIHGIPKPLDQILPTPTPTPLKNTKDSNFDYDSIIGHLAFFIGNIIQ
jgi:hypothetical protein